jgi:hypothetical protein
MPAVVKRRATRSYRQERYSPTANRVVPLTPLREVDGGGQA